MNRVSNELLIEVFKFSCGEELMKNRRTCRRWKLLIEASVKLLPLQVIREKIVLNDDRDGRIMIHGMDPRKEKWRQERGYEMAPEDFKHCCFDEMSVEVYEFNENVIKTVQRTSQASSGPIPVRLLSIACDRLLFEDNPDFLFKFFNARNISLTIDEIAFSHIVKNPSCVYTKTTEKFILLLGAWSIRGMFERRLPCTTDELMEFVCNKNGEHRVDDVYLCYDIHGLTGFLPKFVNAFSTLTNPQNSVSLFDFRTDMGTKRSWQHYMTTLLNSGDFTTKESEPDARLYFGPGRTASDQKWNVYEKKRPDGWTLQVLNHQKYGNEWKLRIKKSLKRKSSD